MQKIDEFFEKIKIEFPKFLFIVFDGNKIQNISYDNKIETIIYPAKF